jgi:K+-transporting ATPase ATPase C chain
MVRHLRAALAVFVLLSVMTGILYPLAVTGIAQAVFPSRANGSIIVKGHKPVGSGLIGQEFSSPAYFWGRVSATSPVPYTSFNAATLTGSTGSNLAPTNPALIDSARARIDALHAADVAAGYARPAGERIPVDLVTSSASGLDPHISPAAAEYQAPRVAQARHLGEDAVREAIRRHTTGRVFGVLGEPVVNVLELNLDLDSAR